ncbi:hypothetical protein [Allobranchiibius sp. CTAmp26]|uniref:hypothetical protein n=1 Tax=Allobranchiibius sp. CTAmp26 TaxID=2815214 RepID=UPI001AA0F785|nr:hypothetical protein [Allobranchiibius sp. CTAmp26]MBO1755634.1 hypothetical protein [Allobranchiibius sp. CTAmp26]
MRLRDSLTRWSPGLVAFLAAVIVAGAYGVGAGDIARYVLATVWSVLLPGVLVLRWCRPPSRTALEEACVGGAVGLMTQLVGWGIFVGTGAPSYLILWPLVPLVLSAAVPALRRRVLRRGYAERTPWWAAWSLVTAYVLSVALLATGLFRTTPLPPATGRWYGDLYWHLSISAQAKRTAPPVVPQVDSGRMSYHWFSNAHMAADSLISHVGVLVVLARLWYLPVYALTLGLTYLVASRLARTPKAGVIALVLLLAPQALLPVRWIHGIASNAFVAVSPSEVLGVPMLLLVVWWVAELVRRRPARWPEWVLLGLMLVTAAGSKSSNLPVLVCGILLVLAVQILRRRFALRFVALTVLVLAVLVVTAPFLAGGSAASRLDAGYSLRVFRARIGLGQMAEQHAGPLTALLVLLALVIVLQYAGLLLTIPLRRDPAAVLLLGTVVGGLVAMLLIRHPAQSQIYFMLGVLPVADVLIAWGFAVLVHRSRLSAARLLAAAVAGFLLIEAARWITAYRGNADGVLVRVIGMVAVLLVVLAVVAVTLRRTAAARRSVGAALAAAVLMGAVTGPSAYATAHNVLPPSRTRFAALLPAPAVAGTTWLRTRVPADQMIATNVHCAFGPNRPFCDSRGFWVTGLGEHRAYVEAWGYTDQAQATAGHGLGRGVPWHIYSDTAFWDPARLRLNDAAFSAPTPAVLRRLYDAGVRVLFADSASGPVSAHLKELADPVFSDGPISAYRLRAS